MLQKRYLGCDFYVKNDVRVGTKVAKQIISNDDDDFFYDKLFRESFSILHICIYTALDPFVKTTKKS